MSCRTIHCSGSGHGTSQAQLLEGLRAVRAWRLGCELWLDGKVALGRQASARAQLSLEFPYDLFVRLHLEFISWPKQSGDPSSRGGPL